MKTPLAACDSYSLPHDIAEVVDIITPTVQPNVKLTRVNRLISSGKRAESNGAFNGPIGCDEAITPDCLKALYNMTYTPTATDRNTLGIGIFLLVQVLTPSLI